MRLSGLVQLGFLGLAAAAPLTEKRDDSAPSVTINDGTVIGSSSNGVETFNGIPFADPPTGTLRLKPPQALSAPFGTLTATGLPASCPQFLTSVNSSILPEQVVALIDELPFVQTITNQQEDCLTVNVQRPAGTTSDANLPVLFWIFGGGFELGSTATYDGSGFVSEANSLGNDVIFVAVNYRVGGFGFLAGSELQSDGSTNLGLRDQRLGLQWVADNIAAFGGDPTKVTIWGESAGAISVFDQMIANGGDITYNGNALFRGAIMSSGSAVPADDVASAKPQAVYDAVVQTAGCSGQSDTLSCLRGLDYETFLNAVNSVPGIFDYQSLDLSYVPRPDPNDNFFPVSPDEATNYPDIPIIIGDQQDEGTLFSLVQFNITNTDELVTYLSSFFPGADASTIQGLVDTYPDDASDGSPFNTDSANEIYPEFKRLAAILGDATFTLTRRITLNKYFSMGGSNAWSYINNYLYGLPILGTFHASDILEDFFSLPSSDVSSEVRQYFISFVTSLDPNAISGETNWPGWTTDGITLLEINDDGTSTTTDDFRQSSFEYLQSNIGSFHI